MSHTQWLYRNFTLHHYTRGYLHQRTEQEIKREVELLANTCPSDLPQECRYLLELPQWPSPSSSLVHDKYWVLAMKAAKGTLLRKEKRWAEQGCQARQRALPHSRNLLDGVHLSLRCHLNINKLDATQRS